MINILKYPFYVLAVAGTAKSFLQNPVIGSERLNAWGLHKWRVLIAAKMADSRRRRQRVLLTAEERERINTNGFLLKENFLSEQDFENLRSEIYANRLDAREMRQGQAVNRMVPLGPRVLQAMPETGNFCRGRKVRDLISYTASYGGEPVITLQTIIADTSISRTDPQTELHSDTFHPTAKAWFFLHDVGPDDGPFIYVPGSHRLTPKRLEWEYKKSLTARRDDRLHHSLGSFRITESELSDLGYVPKTFTVRANTLVVADTRGFHGRSPSPNPTIRVSLYVYLRRNPFIPWTGMDFFSLPYLRGRSMDMYLAYLDYLERNSGKRSIWRDVGKTAIDAPANI